MSLTDYRTLGRSGLVVSPLALGTMTFGTARWGLDEAGSRAVLDAYVETGGNFVDTADVYSSGRSEEMLGRFIAERGLRDKLVLATKAGFSAGDGPHAGGSGARHLARALDGSLTRLRTDVVDLYWLHVWDGVTPAEELLGTMVGFVRVGKIRYWGLSNVPAWFAAKVATLAAARGLPGPIALQYFYSLVNRDVEDEHVPLARGGRHGPRALEPAGLWAAHPANTTAPQSRRRRRAPVACRETRLQPERLVSKGDKRLDGANPFGDTLFTERNWRIVDVLRRVAARPGSHLRASPWPGSSDVHRSPQR